MPLNENLELYLCQNIRNRLVFSNQRIEGLEYVDVGSILASYLKENYSGGAISHLPMDSIFSGSHSDANIGRYLALDNIEILFEPELKLNIQSILDSYSKNQVLLIRTDAEIEDGFLIYDRANNRKLPLNDLSYIRI